MQTDNRIISWFSCGAASAVATKLAIKKYQNIAPVTIAYTEVIEEHPDNKRFLKDCEKWFGQEILILGNDKYDRSIYKVYEKTRYLKGPEGAACTRLLKKEVRKSFERDGDVQIFGYTSGEEHRVNRFIDANPDVQIETPLIDNRLDKNDCLALIERAGIDQPIMYKLGYKNNNCIGCVKGEAGYWNKIRVDFSDVFARMAAMEQRLGRTVCKIERRVNGKRTIKRIPLKELPPDAGNYNAENSVECGIFCEMAEKQYEGN